MQAIFAILAWSFQVLTVGFFPPKDHAGNPFLSSWRTKSQGKVLIALHFSQKLEETGKCTKTHSTSVGGLAQTTFAIGAMPAKRPAGIAPVPRFGGAREKTTMGHFADCITEGRQISALFPAPGLQIDCFVIDWLHACDLGVAQDFLANLIYFLLDRFPGASKDKRLSSVFRSMQSFYRRCSVDNRLDTLTMECSGRLTKKQTKSQLPSLEHLLGKPGLSYHGAWKLQKHCWTSPTLFENTIFQATLQLNACYSLQSRDLWNPQELAIAGQRFLLLYVSLCDSDPEGMFWRFKPKHHLFQELCEFDERCPSQNWTYRDDRYGWDSGCYFKKKGWRTLFAIWCLLVFFSPCFILLWFDAT